VLHPDLFVVGKLPLETMMSSVELKGEIMLVEVVLLEKMSLLAWTDVALDLDVALLDLALGHARSSS
jgi:hypothetical protein